MIPNKTTNAFIVIKRLTFRWILNTFSINFCISLITNSTICAIIYCFMSCTIHCFTNRSRKRIIVLTTFTFQITFINHLTFSRITDSFLNKIIIITNTTSQIIHSRLTIICLTLLQCIIPTKSRFTSLTLKIIIIFLTI